MVNEISIMRDISNKNIIRLYTVYETMHSIYLVMQLLTGGDLNEKIAEKSIKKYSDIQLILRRLLNAIDYLHKK